MGRTAAEEKTPPPTPPIPRAWSARNIFAGEQEGNHCFVSKGLSVKLSLESSSQKYVTSCHHGVLVKQSKGLLVITTAHFYRVLISRQPRCKAFHMLVVAHGTLRESEPPMSAPSLDGKLREVTADRWQDRDLSPGVFTMCLSLICIRVQHVCDLTSPVRKAVIPIFQPGQWAQRGHTARCGRQPRPHGGAPLLPGQGGDSQAK